MSLNTAPALLRLPAVQSRTGLSRARIYAHIAAGTFPRQINLGARAVGWIESEINEWINQRIAESRGGAQ
jgi:prophage regulatory protein